MPGPPIRSNRVHLLPSPRVRTDLVATPHTVPVTPALRSMNCSNFFDLLSKVPTCSLPSSGEPEFRKVWISNAKHGGNRMHICRR